MSVLAGKMSKDDKLNLMFDIYDRDRRGSISRTDMSEFMESMYAIAD
jgi:Ca2+-binding EF-hand superfamily protein